MTRLQAVFTASLVALCAIFGLSLLVAAGVDAAPAHAGGTMRGPALSGVEGPAASFLRAPEQSDPLSIGALVPAAPPVTCTLTTTTTDELELGGIFNDDFASAATLANYTALALAPGNRGAQVPTKDDFFRLNAIQGLSYPVEAKPNQLGNYNFGIIVYNASQSPILTDTNTLDGSVAKVTLVAPSTGLFYFRIFQIVGTSCNGGTYSLTASEATPTPTPTHTPTPTGSSTGSPTPTGTPIPGADRFEPNFDFDHSSLIALNLKYTDLNFAPWKGSDPNAPDNDFFRVWVKPGLLVTCETLDLTPGTDTNLILYDNNLNGIGGNQDIDRASGNFGSRLSFYVTYEGWLYALIGNEYAIDPSQAFNFEYSFQCFTGPGPSSTPTATRPPVTPSPTVPTNTPTPSLTPTSSPTLTPTPPFIQVSQLPTATPAGQPPRVLVPINLTVYYDLNNNRAPDPGEGVVGVSARVVDVTTGQELTHGFTDGFGFASLTVNTSGVVRLSVPYLSQTFILQPSGGSIVLRITPYGLPNTIP